MNPYLKIAIAAVASVYLTPQIINRFVRPEIDPGDSAVNAITAAGITGIVSAGVWVVLGMAAPGGSTAAA